jgi:hypothetical protein
MTISKDEAAQALGEIEAARGRVSEFKAYRYASPFLIIWGLVWIGADAAIQFEPGWGGWPWLVGVAVGLLACVPAWLRMPRPAPVPGRRAPGWRNFGAWLVVTGFVVSIFLVVPVTSGREVHSIFGLVFGFLYLGAGLWLGWRLVALGAGLVALTLIGFYAVGAWYALYMGLVAGGALLLGGLWLRKL